MASRAARDRIISTALLLCLSCTGDDASPETRHDGETASEVDAGEEAAEADDAPLTEEVGAACSEDTSCAGGRCLLKESVTGVPFPDGYCSARCRDDAECGAPGFCAPGFLGAAGSCFRRCDDDSDCARDGYRCRVSNAIGRCMPGPEPLPDDVVGNPCEDDAECGGGSMTCRSALSGVDAPAGYCSQSCATHSDCGASGMCLSGLGPTFPLSIGICLKRCIGSEDCRAGYTCRALSQAEGAVGGLCTPETGP
jgi:hypothetical protein